MAKFLIAAGLIAALAGGTARGAATLEKRAPRPHHGKTFVVTPTKGHVIVYRRGNRKIAGVPVAPARKARRDPDRHGRGRVGRHSGHRVRR